MFLQQTYNIKFHGHTPAGTLLPHTPAGNTNEHPVVLTRQRVRKWVLPPLYSGKPLGVFLTKILEFFRRPRSKWTSTFHMGTQHPSAPLHLEPATPSPPWVSGALSADDADQFKRVQPLEITDARCLLWRLPEAAPTAHESLLMPPTLPQCIPTQPPRKCSHTGVTGPHWPGSGGLSANRPTCRADSHRHLETAVRDGGGPVPGRSCSGHLL